MNTKEILELISDIKDSIIEDYKFLHKKNPDKSDLLNHVKFIIKENREEEILSDALMETDFEGMEEIYKLLLVSAATFENVN